jgi:hypothetical protein
LIRSVEACALFVGAGWTNSPARDVAHKAQAFIEFFVTSQMINQLAVFNRGTWQVSWGTAHPAVYLDRSLVNAEIDDSEIRAFLKAAIGTNGVPDTTPDSLYVLFFPEGVTVTDPDVGASCDRHCGYHSNDSGTPYIVMPYLSCGFCLPAGTSVADAMTAALSHEICEAVTDPLGNAWYADNATQDEIGDLCNSDGWNTKRAGGFLVQQLCLPSGVCW